MNSFINEQGIKNIQQGLDTRLASSSVPLSLSLPLSLDTRLASSSVPQLKHAIALHKPLFAVPFLPTYTSLPSCCLARVTMRHLV